MKLQTKRAYCTWLHELRKTTKTLSGKPVSNPRFKSWTSRITSKSDCYAPAAAFCEKFLLSRHVATILEKQCTYKGLCGTISRKQTPQGMSEHTIIMKRVLMTDISQCGLDQTYSGEIQKPTSLVIQEHFIALILS